ncbi:SpoIIE family protein phosphatase [Kitasatospora sp. NPDC059146]|uniref:SpoIIE family protein phosphatase n=1 Tax=Kitasatospora sp. NPDC059146 TaxID=3346741 RepID=UPI003682BDC0
MTAEEEPGRTTARALAATVRRLQDAAARTREEARRRTVVDVATGMLAERLGLVPAEASARLARLAREAGVPVPTLAADIARIHDATPEAPEGGLAAPPHLTPALAAETDLQRAADAVLEQTDPLGVRGVALWQRLPGGALALAAHAGLTADEAAVWSRVPPRVDTPAQHVVQGGTALWPGDRAAALPSIGAANARAVLPLLDGGRCRGAFEVLWSGPAPALGPSHRRLLVGLADLCATLLGPVQEPEPADELAVLLEGLLSPALLLEPVIRGGQATDFTLVRVSTRFDDPLGRPRQALEGASLLETYPLACATGLFERLLRAHRTGIPLPGESVKLGFTTGRLALPADTQLAIAPFGGRLVVGWQLGTSPSDDDQQVALLRQAQRLARVAGFEELPGQGVIRWSDGLRELFGLPPEAAPVPLRHLTRLVHPDDEPAVRRLVDTVRQRHRTASGVFRLALPDGTHRYAHVIAEPLLDDDGRLLAIRGAYHDVSAQHRTEVALDATQERLVDSEKQASEGEQLALRLQQAILPSAPPPLAAMGLRATVRYRPAAQRDRVGGDWYDVLPLPDERVLLAVGDVAGHGVGAATGMVALRHALRGLAVTGAGPGRLLEWANAVALREPGQVTATAACVLFDPAAGQLRWARAGHLPPVRFSGEGAELLPLPHGVLLGALQEARYEERTVRLGTHDVLLLYTDGLVERRDRPAEESVNELIRAAGPPGPDLEHYLDRLLALSSADTQDDTCLIAVRVE